MYSPGDKIKITALPNGMPVNFLVLQYQHDDVYLVRMLNTRDVTLNGKDLELPMCLSPSKNFATFAVQVVK